MQIRGNLNNDVLLMNKYDHVAVVGRDNQDGTANQNVAAIFAAIEALREIRSVNATLDANDPNRKFLIERIAAKAMGACQNVGLDGFRE